MLTSKEPKDTYIFQEEQDDEKLDEGRKHVADRVKLYEANVKTSTTPTHIRKNNKTNRNNLQHVVPVGVLIVLFTLYLTTAALTRNYNSRREQATELERIERAARLHELHELEVQRRTQILAKLLEYKDLCTELEIFTKDLRWIDEFSGSGANSGDGEKVNNVDYDDVETALDIELEEHDEQEGIDISENSENTPTMLANSGDASSEHLLTKSINQKQRGKRNGQRHSNKSMKIKNGRIKLDSNHNKKEQAAKKSNTAEPIIYLFALVFIYLLLKAASDINQHYKSQNKGDKRIRRCSLQSYAQTHKQDRRASKESPKKPNKQRLMESRSKSVDRYNDPTTAEELARKKFEILANLRKYTSLDEPTQRLMPNRHNVTYSGCDVPFTAETRQIAELIVLNPTNIVSNSRNTEPSCLYANNRRCSVPVSLNYQRQKLTAIPLAPISTVARRTSISGVHIGAVDAAPHGEHGAMDAQFQEVKRRVRMINRH